MSQPTYPQYLRQWISLLWQFCEISMYHVVGELPLAQLFGNRFLQLASRRSRFRRFGTPERCCVAVHKTAVEGLILGILIQCAP